MNSRQAWTVYLISLLVAAMHMTWARNVLPATVASHFGASGQADSFTDADGFLRGYAVLMLFMALTFGGLARLFPRLPDSVFNIPHRPYWLAPERRAATLNGFVAHYLLIGTATNLFLVGTMHATVVANRQIVGEPRLPGWFWLLFTVYMVGVIAWAIMLTRRYRRVPGQP